MIDDMKYDEEWDGGVREDSKRNEEWVWTSL